MNCPSCSHDVAPFVLPVLPPEYDLRWGNEYGQPVACKCGRWWTLFWSRHSWGQGPRWEFIDTAKLERDRLRYIWGIGAG